jgi:hypothetical protein
LRGGKLSWLKTNGDGELCFLEPAGHFIYGSSVQKKSLEAGWVQNLNYGFKNTGRLAGNWREEFILVVGLKYLQTQRREK